MRHVPWWFTTLTAILGAGALALTWAAADIVAQAGWLSSNSTGWLFPAYVVILAICAWACYPTRRTLAWVLIAVLALSIAGLAIATFALKA